MTEEAIFAAALEKADPAARTAFLDQACGDAQALRKSVEGLLLAHERPGGPLEHYHAPEADADRPVDGTTRSLERPVPRITEGPGSRIGPYKLLQEIGQGGMGSVFMAEQEHPIRRRVALKLIKPGMDTDQVIARFEAERQALALMDHTNIARVLDAGTTGTGRPYFVMELVKGVPITEYCDQNRLDPRQRLELFIPVCQAIQHAHQKGIIHRDVKPSNILVTLHDGVPVSKVIDFGIAKAIDQRLTERTLFTQFGAVIGTPEYMSPEQAGMGGLDIDTRSDIYSLGALLYELLTGTTPLQKKSLRQAAFNEIMRRIKEEEPPKPSTRLLTTEELPAIAAHRQTEPARLSRLMRGELDWIVMKALEKDRTRRYGTASDLVRDIERYLHDEPVEAGPPSVSYRMLKYASRYRAALFIAAAFGGLLLLGAVVSAWQAYREYQARNRAEAAFAQSRVSEARAKEQEALARRSASESEAVLKFFLEHVLAATRPEGQEGGLGKDVTIRRAVDAAEPKISATFKDQPTVEASIRAALGATYYYLGENRLAIRQLERSGQIRSSALGPEHPDTLISMNDLGMAYGAAGMVADALPLLEETLKLRKTTLSPEHPDILTSMDNLADAYNLNGRLPEAIQLHTEVLQFRRATLGLDHADTLLSMNNLAMDLQSAGRRAEALPLLEETLKLRKATLSLDHPYTIGSMDNLANFYHADGRLPEAIALHTEALKLGREKLGHDNPQTLTCMNNLAMDFHAAGHHAEAMPLLEETLKLRKAKLSPEHPDTLASMDNLANRYHADGRFPEAIALHTEVLKLRKATQGPDHPDTLLTMNNLAEDLRTVGRTADAIALNEETLKHRLSKLGPDHPYTVGSRANLGRAYLDAGSFSQAETMFRQCLAIRQRDQPEEWTTFNTRSLLGGSLLGQKKFAEAETMILPGYEGMKAREASIPASARSRLTDAAGRVIKLYEDWGKKDKAFEWRARLAKTTEEPKPQP